ncbi:MAG: ATP-binding protein [Halopseudomonas aestusnigri]
MKLTPKILLTVTAIIGLVYGGASYIIGEKSRDILSGEIDRYLEANLENARQNLEQRQKSVFFTTTAIAANRTVEKALYLSESRGINQEINDAVQIFPYFSYILVVDPEGYVFASTTRDSEGNKTDGEMILGEDVSEHPLYGNHHSGEAFISRSGSDPYLSDIGLPDRAAQWYVFPIEKRGNFIGSVVISYDWASEVDRLLADIQSNLESVGNPTKSILITDAKGIILAAVGELSNQNAGETVSPGDNDLWRSIALNEEDKQSYQLVIINDLKQTLAPATGLQNLMTIWTVGGILALIILLFLFSRRYLVQRISSLVKGTDELRGGNLAYRIDDSYQDELGTLANAFNKMSDQLERTTVSRNEVDGIVQSMSSALFVVLPNNQIQTINNAAQTLLGLPDTSILNQTINRFIRLKTNDAPQSDVCAFLKEISDSGETYNLIAGDDTEIPVLLSGALTRNDIGQITGAVIIATDITERLKLEKIKDDFLSTMSHELRSPLSSILGYCDLLKTEDLNDTSQSYLQSVQTAGRHLLRLIGDILDFSKIETGNMALESIPFSINEVSEEIISTLLIKAREENSELVLNIDQDLPQWLIGDPTRFRQIIMNFLSNALKFTQNGTVTLQVECLSLENEHVEVKVSVIDTGLGISEDKIGKLFKSFTQVDNTISRTFGGTGLGLSISKQLAEAMNGSVGVESQEGRGSTFWFQARLPVSTQTREVTAQHQDFEIEPLSILLVEDIELNRIMARLLLQKAGHTVSEACDGKEAVDKVTSDVFDVVLMDIHMPGMSGVDATKLIRKLPDQIRANIPIIALTADVAVHNIDFYLSVGMSAYVSKPIDFKLLNSQFCKLGLGKDKNKPSFSSEIIEIDDIPLVDFKSLHAAIELLPNSLEMFKKEAIECLETSHSSHDASDWAKYKQDIHILRNLALNLGFIQLRDLCGKAEITAELPPDEIDINISARQLQEIDDCLSNTLLQVEDHSEIAPDNTDQELLRSNNSH